LLTRCGKIIYLKKGDDFMEQQKVQRTTLTMKEAAEYLGISYWLINQLVRKKQIPCSKVGGKFLFRIQALNEYLSTKEKESVNF
jgi:excisionase family DNA binding protein